jgi:hypothetical protein
MKLATAQEVLARLAAQTGLTGFVASADSALNAATPIIENILGTPLEAAERIDFYDFLPGTYGETSLQQARFYLTQMFVDGPISVYVSADGTPLNSVAGLTPVAEGLQLFAQPGEFLFTSSAVYSGRSQIAVKYAAGFSDASPDIPSWLKEAAISSAIRAMHSQALVHNKKDVRDMSVELHRIAYQQLNNRVRTRYDGIHPSSTMVL